MHSMSPRLALRHRRLMLLKTGKTTSTQHSHSCQLLVSQCFTSMAASASASSCMTTAVGSSLVNISRALWWRAEAVCFRTEQNLMLHLQAKHLTDTLLRMASLSLCFALAVMVMSNATLHVPATPSNPLALQLFPLTVLYTSDWKLRRQDPPNLLCCLLQQCFEHYTIATAGG